MSQPSIRPRFELLVDASCADVLERIEDRIEQSESTRGWVSSPYAELRVRAEDRQLWSPRMSIHAEEVEGGTRLLCRMQPEPDVWTAYVAMWSIVGVVALGGLVFGASRWVMGSLPWGVVVGAPVVGLLCVILYITALIGQRRGEPQMVQLERELHGALEGLGFGDELDERPRIQGFGAPS